MHAEPQAFAHPTTGMLQEALRRQREACLAQPMPTLSRRRFDLDQLPRFVRENETALIEAISADYGRRSPPETRLTEIGPLMAGIRHTRSHLRRWMKAQRRGIDRLA